MIFYNLKSKIIIILIAKESNNMEESLWVVLAKAKFVYNPFFDFSEGTMKLSRKGKRKLRQFFNQQNYDWLYDFLINYYAKKGWVDLENFEEKHSNPRKRFVILYQHFYLIISRLLCTIYNVPIILERGYEENPEHAEKLKQSFIEAQEEFKLYNDILRKNVLGLKQENIPIN